MLRLSKVFNVLKTIKVGRHFSSSILKHINLDQFHGCYFTRRAYKTASTYIEEMYNAWLRDPTSVHRSWDAYFRSAPYVDMAAETETKQPLYLTHALSKLEAVSPIDTTIDDHAAVHAMIRSYQTHGFVMARLNPLDTSQACRTEGETVKSLFSELYFRDDFMDREFRLPNDTYIGGSRTALPFPDIVKRLESIYCNNIGIEYMHINSTEQRNWLRQRFEPPDIFKIDALEQRLILTRLIRTNGFESFLAKKFPTTKRFSIEGCEALIPALKKIIDVSSESGIESVIIGMPQRGRLNTLANVCRKPLRQIFSLFTNAANVDDDLDDIKYCYGTCIERLNRVSLRPIRIAVVASPAHLEAFVPVTQGRTRSEQFYRNDEVGNQVMSILVHNDAPFYGQGVVCETLNLTQLPDYNTFGTIHVVISDQTSEFKCAQCTNVARAIEAPIFHVNADDPEAVTYASKIAAEWRANFHKDIVLHLIGYRRQADLNFDDELIFMQPQMYQKIRKHQTCLDSYKHKLMGTNVVTPEEAKRDMDDYKEHCQEAFTQASKELRFQKWFWIDSPWTDFFESKIPFKVPPTGVDLSTLIDIGTRLLTPPKNKPDFVLHKALHRILADRKAMVDSRTADWALAESLAFGSLLKEGIHVRLAGQDVQRGPYSQRHHVLHHQLVENVTHNLLQHLYPNQATYTVSSSSLSEYAALGFELGYSITNPNALVLWEAQYGDFSNTAQCIIDELLASGQSNLMRQSGLVLLLPHGMEGMGPEFSSARLERFLQMSSDDPDHFPQDVNNFPFCQLRDANWIVANCTTPANYFHILRRQIALPFRKPLILMTPKSLLRDPAAISSFRDMYEGTVFQNVIPDQYITERDPGEVKKVIFCSGRIYYDLVQKRAEKNLEGDVVIVRIEQLSPFPFDLVRKEMETYNRAEFVWAQEEHKNQGAWSYVQPRFRTAVPDTRDIVYAGRPASASTATNSKHQHLEELNQILNEATNVDACAANNEW